MAYREFRSQRLRHWRISIDGLSCLAFSVGRFQPARRRESKERFVDMPLVLAPPLNLQRTLSPAVRRLPALLGRSAIAVADALKSALRLLPAQILRELAHVI